MLFDFSNSFWKKKNIKDSIPENVTCKNCHTTFDGNYCPVCGQAVKELERPFGFIVINFVGDMFAFDSRFFRTAGALLFKPGYLTRQFFDGKRIRYATPTRLFILSSFILFFLLQIYSNRILNNVLDTPVSGDTAAVTDSIQAAYAGTSQNRHIPIADSTSVELPGMTINLDAFTKKENLREGLVELSNQMEEELNNEEDPEEKAKLREQIRLLRTPEQAIAKILKYMSWVFFLLLPVFALILKLFYIRRGYYYFRHLVFSIHLHTFIFIVYTIIVTLLLLFPVVHPYITFAFILSIPVYFIAALKRFYGQNIFKVILKFTGISIMYGFLFWIIVGGVFLRALSII